MAAKTPENTFNFTLHGRGVSIAGDPQSVLNGTDTAVLLYQGKQLAQQRNLITFVAAGSNGAGPVTVSGAQTGDLVTAVINLTTPGNAQASFESVVSVAGQVQQISASNLSGNNYIFVLRPQS